MKSKFIRLILLLIIPVLTVRCGKEFLDVPSKSLLLKEDYVKDLPSLQAFLNGIYLDFSVANGTFFTAYPELIADNLRPLPPPAEPIMLTFYNWKQQADQTDRFLSTAEAVNANNLYKSYYKVANACNFVVNHIEKFRTTDAQKVDNMKGQAYLIRAMVYFQLVNMYAQAYNFTPQAGHPGVAYITTDEWTEQPGRRNTVAEVYTAMVADLQQAKSLLPEQTANTRLPSKITAGAYLSRVYLFKGDYESSKSEASQVLQKVSLMTIANGYPADVFKDVVPQKTEVLLQFLPRKISGANVSGAFLGQYLRDVPLKYFTATSDVTQLLLENIQDVRSSWVTPVAGVNNISKFPTGVVGTAISEVTQYYHCVIRSSEVCLNAAESLAQLGQESEARNYLDMIIKRANPVAVSTTASGTALMDLIRKERRKELAFEGLRMYDLQRWKQNVRRSDALSAEGQVLIYPSPKAIAPIPLTDVNAYGLEQNPGYSL